jgi:hypothetical protein
MTVARINIEVKKMSCCYCKSCHAIRTGDLGNVFYNIPFEFTSGNKCMCWVDGVRCAFRCLKTECNLGQEKVFF